MNPEMGFGFDDREMLSEIEKANEEDPKPIILHGVTVTLFLQ